MASRKGTSATSSPKTTNPFSGKNVGPTGAKGSPKGKTSATSPPKTTKPFSGSKSGGKKK